MINQNQSKKDSSCSGTSQSAEHPSVKDDLSRFVIQCFDCLIIAICMKPTVIQLPINFYISCGPTNRFDDDIEFP